MDGLYMALKPENGRELIVDTRNGEVLKKELKVEYFRPFRVKGAKNELKGEYIITPLGMAEYRPEDNYAVFSDSVCKDCISGSKVMFNRSDIEVKPAMPEEWCKERREALSALGVEVPAFEFGTKLDVTIDNRTWFPDYSEDDNFGARLLVATGIGVFMLVAGLSTVLYEYR